MLCGSLPFAALAALALSGLAQATPHFHGSLRSKRHASIKSAFSPRAHAAKRQNFLHTKQPSNLAKDSTTAEEGCTLWIQPWDGASCLAAITYSPGLIMDDFIELNPSVDAACTNFESNKAYCIDTDEDHTATATAATTSATGRVAKQSTCRSRKKASGKSSSKAKAAQTSTKTPIKIAGATATSSTAAHATASKVVTGLGGSAALLELDDPTCGPSDPSQDTTDESGPNGKLSWLNCGISKTDESSGWTYPDVHISEIVYQNMSKDGIYSTCSPYFDYFESAGAKYNIPAIFLAAFAMQESSCDANANGDEGSAYGLMQIVDKCDGAPDGNCYDPEFNINRGAEYFASVLEECDGNPFCAAGKYNGWFKGMSYADAVAQANSCCVCQNNLDYMHQFFNAWIQNKSGQDYTPYNNLAICSERTGNS